MLDREAYASLAFIRPPMVPLLRPMALMAYGTNCGSSHAVWLLLAEYCILWMSEKTNPLCGNKTWRNPSSSRRRACSRLPCPTLPPVDAQTSRSWIQNIGWHLAGEITSDNPGSDLAWHDQWVMTSIMTNSYFLFVCAIVTAQGLRHRFTLNKTEEGSPRHSKFLNLFSVVRWEAVINKRISQKMCIARSVFQVPKFRMQCPRRP